MKTKQRNRKYFAMKWAGRILSKKDPQVEKMLDEFIVDCITYNTAIANERLQEKLKIN